MLTDEIQCLDCQQLGSDCHCIAGPSWSIERRVMRELVKWVQESPHRLHCSAYSDASHLCGCGKTSLIKQAKERLKV
jgi:hypothetical protein